MLVLTRKPGQWTTITHNATGQTCRARVENMPGGNIRLIIDDDARNFAVLREEAGGKREGVVA